MPPRGRSVGDARRGDSRTHTPSPVLRERIAELDAVVRGVRDLVTRDDDAEGRALVASLRMLSANQESNDAGALKFQNDLLDERQRQLLRKDLEIDALKESNQALAGRLARLDASATGADTAGLPQRLDAAMRRSNALATRVATLESAQTEERLAWELATGETRVALQARTDDLDAARREIGVLTTTTGDLREQLASMASESEAARAAQTEALEATIATLTDDLKQARTKNNNGATYRTALEKKIKTMDASAAEHLQQSLNAAALDHGKAIEAKDGVIATLRDDQESLVKWSLYQEKKSTLWEAKTTAKETPAQIAGMREAARTVHALRPDASKRLFALIRPASQPGAGPGRSAP